MLSQDIEVRWSQVIEMYLDQKISLAKAAELLNTHAIELRERLQHVGIPLRIGPADLAEAKIEVNTMRGWFTEMIDRHDPK